MTNPRPELWQLLDGMQMDLRAAQAKLTAARSLISGMNLVPPTTVKCPQCDLPMKGPRTLAEHVHVSHDGPIPDHWQAVDEIALEPAEPVEAT